jgi:hypothetical protein
MAMLRTRDDMLLVAGCWMLAGSGEVLDFGAPWGGPSKNGPKVGRAGVCSRLFGAVILEVFDRKRRRNGERLLDFVFTLAASKSPKVGGRSGCPA